MVNWIRVMALLKFSSIPMVSWFWIWVAITPKLFWVNDIVEGEQLAMLRFLRMSELSPLSIVTDVATRFDRKQMESWCKEVHVATSASVC